MSGKYAHFDVEPSEERGVLHLVLKQNNYGAELVIEGYGCMTGKPDTAGIIHIEKESHSGRLTLYVWGDINSEEPTDIIDIELANEKYRQEED